MTENGTGTSSTFPKIFTELPQLPYTLRSRKVSIAIQWGIIFLTSCILINILYFCLRYVAHTDTTIALAVPTALLGAFTVFSFLMRIWRLVRSNSNCRPLGASPRQLDYFQWSYLISFVVVTVLLSTACGLQPPRVRQASMPQAIILYSVGIQLLVGSLLGWTKLRTPFTFSSTTKGSAMIPGVLVIIEDVVAVDGGGGQDFRQALLERYEASEDFRSLLWQMSWFWGGGATAAAVAVTLIIFLVKNTDVVFALGWTLPWAWASIWVLITIPWVQRALAKERCLWDEKTGRLAPV